MLARTVILQKYHDDQVMTLCKWRMRQHCHHSTLPTPRLVVAGGSCWGGGRSGLSAASTSFSKPSCGWEMKEGTLQSNCHRCLGHTTNKGPPEWIIWWITALTCPSGNYFCLLKNPADLKWAETAYISDFSASSSGTKILFLAVLERWVPLGLLPTWPSWRVSCCREWWLWKAAPWLHWCQAWFPW